MNSVTYISLIALTVAGYTYAFDVKNCDCKVRDAATRTVVKDFHSIDLHQHWLHVNCRQLNNCKGLCDATVDRWMCRFEDECMRVSGGKTVVSYYTASDCNKGEGSTRRKCGCVSSTPRPPSLNGFLFDTYVPDHIQ